MDNLVLTRVAAVLADRLVEGVLAHVRVEPWQHYRLVFDCPTGSASVTVSLLAGRPWIGRPSRAPRSRSQAADPFAGLVSRSLVGARLEGLEKPPGDRSVVLRWSSGKTLVVELAESSGNLLLVDERQNLVAAARGSRRDRDRLAVGRPYRSRPRPRSRLDPFLASAREIDDALDRAQGEGLSRVEALGSVMFGLSEAAIDIVRAERADTGLSEGQILEQRMARLLDGRADPAIELGPNGRAWLASQDEPMPATARLLPWAPTTPLAPGASLWQGADASDTAGRWYESVETRELLRRRVEDMLGIARKEIDRLARAERRVEEDLLGFEDPARHRSWGEALLAGSTVARRCSEHWEVPDPLAPGESWVVVPARPGIPVHRAAEEHFRQARRAERARAQATARLDGLRTRRLALEPLLVAAVDAPAAEQASRLAEALRDQGVPVGLEPAVRGKGRGVGAAAPVRLEGVRMFTSSDGWLILIGKTARDNDRLTFRLSGPEDFWFHALGRTGAHVLVRNESRVARPPQATLREAAAAAAFYSESRGEGAVEVQWTRRKYLRRVRGAAAGAVRIKRFETLRVRPATPGAVLNDPGPGDKLPSPPKGR